MIISAPLDAWATSLGMERRTLERRLAEAGLDTRRVPGAKGRAASRGTFTAQEIFNALTGDDLRVQKARREKLEADKLEREEALSRGETMVWADAEKFITENLTLPLRQALIAMPGELAVLCNPGDPALAEQAMRGGIDSKIFPLLREKLTTSQPPTEQKGKQ